MATAIADNGTFEPTVAPEDPYEEYMRDVANKLFMYIQPVITFGGIIGNVLMFMVMQVFTIGWYWPVLIHWTREMWKVFCRNVISEHVLRIMFMSASFLNCTQVNATKCL